MSSNTTGTKLDLSKLTDEEAGHVWAVVQRDFDLRKKEEDRLGELKTKIEKEDTKRELLGSQTSLTESYCIRCLHPFKFLVNTRRQCLDCQLYICKSCSRYNKKEEGWVCDPCHMARVLKIGTLEWYHENVRTRFKRFGSAKVMRSLFKRLDGRRSASQNDLEADGYEEDGMDSTDSQHHRKMKKGKKRLSVDPFDFQLGCDYFMESRHQSNQAPPPHDIMDMDAGARELMLAETDMSSVFHQILEEQHEDDLVSQDNPTPSRSVSRLSYSSCGSSSAWGPRYSSCLPGTEESEGEDDRTPPGPVGHIPQERVDSPNPPPQITDLDRRVSAIENLLNHIEQNVTLAYDQAPPTPTSTSPLPPFEEVDEEEQQLRQKLHELTNYISDRSLTSDEDEPTGPPADAKPSRIPTRPASRASTVLSGSEEQPQQNESQETDLGLEVLDRKCPPLEEESEDSLKSSTSLLYELEDKIAQATADVQNSQSEASYIENRIAALNAAGMPGDRRRRSGIPIQARRISHNSATNQVDRFVRNSFDRGSLTQRNPVPKPKTRATSAKPVMTQGW
ncbi:melanophilin isoform X2 [Antennarius striatus]|uniref:melanophilin isoform X2 n=1 Tax=Antennarius striatus TaxID=241820 RepID=UPI0035B1AE6C